MLEKTAVEKIPDLVYILMRGRVVHFDEVSKLVSKYGSMEEAYFHIKDENNV